MAFTGRSSAYNQPDIFMILGKVSAYLLPLSY
jgi:hypothetical protein